MRDNHSQEVSGMPAPTYYVGLDLDLKGKQVAACIGTRPWKLLAGPSAYSDSLAGFQQLVAWLQHQHCTTKQTVLCMPATGFLGEPLAYYLTLRGYRIAVEPPIKIRRAFPSRKQDRRDIGCREVAEYACRHSKLLHEWHPSADMLHQVQELLTDGGPLAPQATKRGKAPSARSRGAGARLLQARGERTRAVDAELRRLLLPQPTIAEEWPCY
jgi:transposase